MIEVNPSQIDVHDHIEKQNINDIKLQGLSTKRYNYKIEDEEDQVDEACKSDENENELDEQIKQESQFQEDLEIKSGENFSEQIDLSDEDVSNESKIIKREKTRKSKEIILQPDEYYYIDKLPKSLVMIKKLKEKAQFKLKQFRLRYFQDESLNECKKSFVTDQAIPICADIRNFDFQKLRDEQIKSAGQLFDVIMMDPPWQLSSSQPSRGVAIAYSQLADEFISKIPIESLQTDGYIFIWTINAKYSYTVRQINAWGYKIVDELVWVKKTVNGKIAKGHGYYLQHAKEHCIIGLKGELNEQKFRKSVASDVIFSARRGQSQKPEEIYQYIEQLCQNGFCLEIFGRRNNIRQNWVTIGNEI